jgi:integrase
MPGKIPQPWFRKGRGWFVWIEGRQHALGKERDEAFRCFHLLMAGETPTPSPPSTRLNAPPERQDTPGLAVNSLANAYLATCQRRVQKKTLTVATTFVRSFADLFGKKQADTVRKADVEAWLAKHPTWGQTTENTAKVRLVAMFRWGVEEGLLADNPIRGIRKPPVKSRGREALIPAEEHGRMLAGATPALRNVLFALHESGARPGEVLSVTATEFNAEQGVWILTKHKTSHKGRQRIVYLTPGLTALCEQLARQYPTGSLFRSPTGKPWCHTCQVATQLATLRKRLGLTGRAMLYGYRHGYATDALANGVPDAQVAELLGHSGTAMLHKHYSHLTARAKALRDALGKVRGQVQEE